MSAPSLILRLSAPDAVPPLRNKEQPPVAKLPDAAALVITEHTNSNLLPQ
ncbi:MAG: hypothetical protein AAF088_17045 [Pseudomonadota bacterium]